MPPTTDPSVHRLVDGFEGLPLQVQERGPAGAPTVVLVHGYPDSHTVWDLVAEQLEADHHVVTYDVRGAGGSGVPADQDGYRMAALVADLAAVIDATSPDAPVHLVAHDWGSIQSWSAVTDPALAGRVASSTSMSGPGLDHVAAWIRRHRIPGGGRWTRARRQAVRSWYIAAMRLPQAERALRGRLGERIPLAISRAEGVAADDRWPGADSQRNAINGLNLYRANMHGQPRAAVPPTTSIPVQLIVPSGDRYVTPGLFEGIERVAPNVVRRDIGGSHWLPRSQPEHVARLVAEHVAAVEAEGQPSAVAPAS